MEDVKDKNIFLKSLISPITSLNSPVSRCLQQPNYPSLVLRGFHSVLCLCSSPSALPQRAALVSRGWGWVLRDGRTGGLGQEGVVGVDERVAAYS